MGMPLNSLQALTALRQIRNGDPPDRHMLRGTVNAQGTLEALGAFGLCCFVLYDATTDPDLDAALLRRWDFVDRATARNLLFFAPIDPPEVWATDPDVQDRPLMRWWGGDPSSMVTPMKSRDRAEAARWLALLFGPAAGLGSVLVITKSLWSTRGWMMATSAMAIEDQLRRISWSAGGLAGIRPRRSFESDDSRIDDDNLDHELSMVSRETATPLLRVDWQKPLDELMLVVLRCAATQGADEQVAPARRGEMVASLRRLAWAATADASHHQSEAAVVQASAVATVAARAHGGHANHNAAAPIDLISDDAKRYFVQGLDLMQIVESGEFPGLDYRAPCLHWALAAEHELAEVLGHDVRESLGVRLPEYLWRVQPGLDRESVEVGDGPPIPFNRADPNTPRGAIARWQPPTLGGLRLGWRCWYPDDTREGLASFTDCWAAVVQFRNAAAHPRHPIGHGTAVNCLDRVSELLKAIPIWRRRLR
jgi:hypothetical protein